MPFPKAPNIVKNPATGELFHQDEERMVPALAGGEAQYVRGVKFAKALAPGGGAVRNRIGSLRGLAAAARIRGALTTGNAKRYAGGLVAVLTLAASAMSTDLAAAAVWDAKFQGLYGTASKPDALVHFDGAWVDFDFAAAPSSAVRQAVTGQSYIQVTRGNVTTRHMLCQGVRVLISPTAVTNPGQDMSSPGTTRVFANVQGTFDLSKDSVTLVTPSSITACSATLYLRAVVWPAENIGPDDLAPDSSSCSADGTSFSDGPIQYAEAETPPALVL